MSVMVHGSLPTLDLKSRTRTRVLQLGTEAAWYHCDMARGEVVRQQLWTGSMTWSGRLSCANTTTLSRQLSKTMLLTGDRHDRFPTDSKIDVLES